MDKCIDLGKIIEKLRKAGIVEEEYIGSHCVAIKGLFSMKDHQHLLEPDELKVWVYSLHAGTPHSNKACTDLHQWRIDYISD